LTKGYLNQMVTWENWRARSALSYPCESQVKLITELRFAIMIPCRLGPD
jgi:hypothetical protein